MNYLGIDVGSTTLKIVALNERRDVLGWSVERIRGSQQDTFRAAYARFLREHGLDGRDTAAVTTTGYGRRNIPLESRSVTEVSCQAAALNFLRPGLATIIDLGGQDIKIIKLDRAGAIVDFELNDRCSAGTGKFFEVTMASLNIPLEEISNYYSRSTKPLRITSTCTVFAETEIISLISSGERPEDVVKALVHSIASRIMGFLYIGGLEEPVAFTGGVALNRSLVECLEKRLNIPVFVPDNPQVSCALGAALHAAAEGPHS